MRLNVIKHKCYVLKILVLLEQIFDRPAHSILCENLVKLFQYSQTCYLYVECLN